MSKMKKSYNNGMQALFLTATAAMLLTSCYKKFDPDTYKPAFTIGGYASSKDIASGNLVGYWSFDNNLVDSVSNTAGTNVGTTFTNGVKGRALQGADEGYVLFDPTAAILGMQSFTITYWVNSPVNTDGIVGLVNLSNTQGFWGNIDMFFENGSTQEAAKFRAHITNGTKDAWVEKDGLPGVFGNWVNFALSYDAASSTFKFYVNGALSTSKTEANFGPLQFTNSGPMVFGTVQFQTDPSLTSSHGAEDWASYLTGALDEVRIYNSALSDNDVNALVKLEGKGK
jgi:hypothetical protein